MELRGDTCYRAMLARDARFDGHFFVAVSTTGIYCRPICRVRTPKRDRCTFYRTPAEAERAGYRACFRCRPELAPGSARDEALPRLVARAVERIAEGYLNEAKVDDLALELEVTPRHLRRAMEDVIGVSPIELAQSHRLLLAKQLLHDTSMSLTDVAFASGFGSVRRFNALFRERFGTAPSSVRNGHNKFASDAVTVRLGFREPFAWKELLAFLRARAIAGVETISEDEYRRTIQFGDRRGEVIVRRDPKLPALVVEVSPSLAGSLMKIVARLRVLFDLDADPHAIAAHLGQDELLAPMIARVPGLRVPGAFDPFEMALRAILGQQVSVRAATTLASRLFERSGPDVRRYLAAADADEVMKIGVPKTRAAALVELAKTGEVRGEWTREYVAMRAGRDPDAFPASDLGVKKALGGASPKDAKTRAEAWRPWRAYATLYLWTCSHGQLAISATRPRSGDHALILKL